MHLFGLHFAKFVHVAEGDVVGWFLGVYLDSVEADVPGGIYFFYVGEELVVQLLFVFSVFGDAVGNVDTDAFVLDISQIDTGLFKFIFSVESKVTLSEVDAGLTTTRLFLFCCFGFHGSLFC